MKRPLLQTLLAIAGCIPVGAQATEHDDPHIRQVEQHLRLPHRIRDDAYWTLEERMRHYAVVGVSVAVIDHGEIVWARGYGKRNRQRVGSVSTNTLFQAGSISKALTAVAAYRLADSGALKLDVAVNQQLRGWKILDQSEQPVNAVTPAQLINHSAAVNVHGFAGYRDSEPLPEQIQILDGAAPANNRPIRVDGTPGQTFRYSGGGYMILQQLISERSGLPFAQWLQEQVLQPVKMTHSFFAAELSEAIRSQAATGYDAGNRAIPAGHVAHPELAAAGLWSTAEDLAKFVVDLQRALRDGSGQLLDQDRTRTMTEASIDSTVGRGLFLRDTGVSLGAYFEHSGAVDGFLALAIGHRQTGQGAVIMINGYQPEFLDELLYAIADVYQWHDFIAPDFVPLPTTPSERERISGLYPLSDGISVRVSDTDGHLHLDYRGVDAPTNELFKVGELRYIRRERSTPLEFRLLPSGEAELAFVNGDGSRQWFRRMKN